MAVKVHKAGYGKLKIPAVIIAAVVVLSLVAAGIIMSDSHGVSVNDGSKKIEIVEGDGVSSVAQKLKNEGIIKYPLVFKIQAKLGGYDGQIQPGKATIENGMSYEEILNLLTTASRDVIKFTVPEGYEVKQIAQKLEESGIVTTQEFYAALNPDDYDYSFLKNLPQRDGVMEGYLFPATYELSDAMSAHEIIELMLDAFNESFTEEYSARAAEMGMTTDEIITMASIIEREAGGDSERAKVAGVFYNRLNSGMNFQSCATVQYILGERKSVLSIADTQIDSPYNTYIYPGFPIGPICNPGLESIKAALYPEKTDAYYFVLGKDGEHIFSKTYEEHLAAMNGVEQNTYVDDDITEN